MIPCDRHVTPVTLLVESQVPSLEGLPISGAVGDQHAALLGHACLDVGTSKNTYGTGSLYSLWTFLSIYECLPAFRNFRTKPDMQTEWKVMPMRKIPITFDIFAMHFLQGVSCFSTLVLKLCPQSMVCSRPSDTSWAQRTEEWWLGQRTHRTRSSLGKHKHSWPMTPIEPDLGLAWICVGVHVWVQDHTSA